MRNISPEDANITLAVLDRILELRRAEKAPEKLSVPLTRDSILVIKALLAVYQPYSTAFESILIQEGKRSKGGRNSFPSSPRPSPPKPQVKNNNNLLEKLAELEHEQWAHWTKYMLDNLTEKNIRRWKKQIKIPYLKLSEKEKESDREWARKVMKKQLRIEVC